MQRLAWGRGFDMVYFSRRCIDPDPLKQFAPVIHENRKGQGRIAMGFPPPAKVVHWAKKYQHKIVILEKPFPQTVCILSSIHLKNRGLQPGPCNGGRLLEKLDNGFLAVQHSNT